MLKLHHKCPNLKCNCRKIFTFTPHQYMLEGGSIKSKLQKMFKGTQTAWNRSLKPALNIASPYIGMAVSAKLKNPKIGQAATNIIKAISGGKIFIINQYAWQWASFESYLKYFKKNKYNKIDNTNDLMKRCSRCRIISLKSNFQKNKTKIVGLTQHCKLCRENYRKKNIMNITI